METNKILTASLLDLLFENRNKGYGAYELRKTYQQRILKSLVITISFAGLAYAGVAFANSGYQHRVRYNIKPVVELQDIADKKEPEKIPETKPQPQPQVRTEIYTPPVIVDKDKVENPPPTIDDLDSAKIGLIKNQGTPDVGITEPTEIDKGKTIGVIDDTRDKNNEPFTVVQVEAKYNGDWGNFLRRNLRPNVPVDNGAPSGKYKIIIQFIVDIDGTISDIVSITNLGYGMEQEAIRVIKRSDKWEPAFQNGIHVKAYRRQPSTFEVLNED